MTDIERAINIGPVLGAELRAAGITTVEDLRPLGYMAAWRRVHAVAPDRDCANSCLALAGAIEGVRWMKLPAEVRARIAAEARQEVGR
jgi:DNA transformation protein